MRVKPIAAAAMALALSACFGGAKPPPELFTLTAASTRPVETPRTAGPGEAITVVDPTVPQALLTPRVPVYVSPTGIQYVRNAQWVENPGPLFGRLLGETIAARTGRVVLDPRQYTHDPGVRLTGQLQMFGLDPTRMEAVVVYDAAMISGATGVTTNRFEARVPVAEISAAAVAPALNQAANQVATDVAEWIGR